MTFEDDPRTPGRRTWCYPRRQARGALAGLISIAVLIAFFYTACGFALMRNPGNDTTFVAFVVAFFVLLAAFFGVLLRYMWRDLRGKWRGHIQLDEGSIELDLAPFRSVIHRPQRFTGTVRFADLVAVETRLEAYPTLGMANVQRAWQLVRRDAPPVFLFEDRALGTSMATTTHEEVAREIAKRARVPYRDRGMVHGQTGFLGVVAASAPPWGTPALSERREASMWRRAWLTGAVGVAAAIVAALVRGCS